MKPDISVRSTCRIGRSGPKPHTVFTMCGDLLGCRVHIDGVTKGASFVVENGAPVAAIETLFSDPVPCDGTCRGWMRVNDNACAWLESLAARLARQEPLRGAVT